MIPATARLRPSARSLPCGDVAPVAAAAEQWRNEIRDALATLIPRWDWLSLLYGLNDPDMRGSMRKPRTVNAADRSCRKTS